MFHIVLYQPEIAPNCGNIMRLAANMGCTLHLIHPLGFDLEEKKLRRAGLDYKDWAEIKQYQNLEQCLAENPYRVFACTTKGQSIYADIDFQPKDILLFGPETRGLPLEVLNSLPGEQLIKIPMQAQSRSINLANSVSIIAYEAWRQQGFAGAGI
ncbi:MAG: tRNA (cytidine(34)-2'-O)-methyltransferase [Gammaproteobacteria bacterium]|nr:tRNA (cytidine(34)-2'-O)-methyltransferase [Gammaproteobacteria bacterium]MDH5730844.1 tRNA (cytidine(34)-2'-O)-methyltransferase [Gammaproteobacteria bacterium]